MQLMSILALHSVMTINTWEQSTLMSVSWSCSTPDLLQDNLVCLLKTTTDLFHSGYCGNLPNAKASLAAGTDCNMTCSANSTQYCGGSNRLSLYTRSVESKAPGPNIGASTLISSSQSPSSTGPSSHNTITVTISISKPPATSSLSMNLTGAPHLSTLNHANTSISTPSTGTNTSKVSSTRSHSESTTHGSNRSVLTTTRTSIISLTGSTKLTHIQTSPLNSQYCQTTDCTSSLPCCNSANTPTNSTADARATQYSSDTHSSAGEIAGIAVGTIALVALLLAGVYFLKKHRAKRPGAQDQNSEWWEQEVGGGHSSALSGGLAGGIRVVRGN